jgi:hypothetical protein
MTVMALWNDLLAGASMAASERALTPLPQAARGPLDARRALADALAELRQPEPICFSDTPDHDFVALAHRYDRSMLRLADALMPGMTEPELRQLTHTAAETRRRHAAWSRTWLLQIGLGDAWVLDGASVRLRFVHDRLRHDLAFAPGAQLDRDYGLIAMCVAHRSADLAHAAVDLCRHREVRCHATAVASLAGAEAIGFRDWLLKHRGERLPVRH